jgi:lysophospholipase L1-like esterase
MAGVLVSASLGLVLSVVAGELVVRLFVPNEKFWPIASIYQPVTTPGVVYTMKPGYDGVVFGVDLRVNRFGFRGPEWEPQKPAGVVRIALLGDSHAFGYGLPFENTVGEVSARLLNAGGDRRYEVLNFAISGYNSKQEYAVWSAFAQRFQPDLVVVLATDNDDESGYASDPKGYLYLRSEVGAASGDPRVREWVDGLKGQLHSALVQSHLYTFVKRSIMELRRQPESITSGSVAAGEPAAGAHAGQSNDGLVSPALVDSVLQPLRKLIEEARAQEIPVIIAALNSPRTDFERLYRRLSQEKEIPLLDLRALFPDVEDLDAMRAKYDLGWDTHFNAVVHDRWASGLVALIEAESLLSKRQQQAPTGTPPN